MSKSVAESALSAAADPELSALINSLPADLHAVLDRMLYELPIANPQDNWLTRLASLKALSREHVIALLERWREQMDASRIALAWQYAETSNRNRNHNCEKAVRVMPPNCSPQLLSKVTPGSLVRTSDKLGIVSINPNDPARTHCVAEFAIEASGARIRYRHAQMDREVLNLGEDFTVRIDPCAPVEFRALPSVSAGSRLFMKSDRMYLVTVIPQSHEYRLLDIAAGTLVVDRGEFMVGIDSWKLGVDEPGGVQWVLQFGS